MAAPRTVPPGPRVFISSTYLDNQHRRTLVEDAIIRAEMVPVGMERFAAAANPAVDVCTKLAAECDVYVGIVAHRYGWEPPGHDGKSITWLEYEAAKGRPRLMFEIDPALPLDKEKDLDAGAERWSKQDRLEKFRAVFRADQMPTHFREDTLHGIVLHALYEHLKSLRPATRPGEPSPATTDGPLAAALNLYREAMLKEHGSIELGGFKTKLRVPIKLEDLYIRLHAMVDRRACGDADHFNAENAKEVLKRCGSDEIELIEAFRCARQLQRTGLVILGEPGSGKTTHLKKILVACWRDSPATLGLPPDMVPVFLPLRRFQPGLHLADFIDREMNPELLPRLGAKFGERLLACGQVLLLFDGLDEIADPSQRVDIVHWVEQVADAHPTCVPVVTCRFAGYGRQAGTGRSREVRLGEKFLELHVRPLESAQTEEFVRNWYRIVETGLQDDRPRAEALARERADALIAELAKPDFRAARVTEMVRNPLLLANLCLVHRDGGALPRGRVRLYQECVEVLLERWREGRGQVVNVTAEQGRRVLQPAALWLHEKEGRTRASAAELAPVLEPALRTVRWGGGDATDFLRTVRDESGLLTGWGPDEFGFMHLGFQEYLAAGELRRILSENKDEAPAALRSLASRYGDSWWQEVLLLLVGVGNPSVFEPLMRAVVAEPAFASRPEILGLLLEEAAEVSAKPFVELLEAKPGKRASELWSRQLVALEVLERIGAKAQLGELAETLRQHPSPEISSRFAPRTAPDRRVRTTQKGGVELVYIQGGKFRMGSPPEEEERYDHEGPAHEVTLSPFWLGRFPVTNEEFGRYMKENPSAKEPAYWGDRRFNQARQPVVGVSWEEAAAFAAWAGCRLPTEAEWEYACRAGSTGPRYAEDLDEIAWYDKNSGGQTQVVGGKAPNAWGLADMLGNVSEWCEDWYSGYEPAPATNPTGPQTGDERVYRGGSWSYPARNCRSAYRGWRWPGERDPFLGFRLASGQ